MSLPQSPGYCLICKERVGNLSLHVHLHHGTNNYPVELYPSLEDADTKGGTDG